MIRTCLTLVMVPNSSVIQHRPRSTSKIQRDFGEMGKSHRTKIPLDLRTQL